jgi:hypothetical protein
MTVSVSTLITTGVGEAVPEGVIQTVTVGGVLLFFAAICWGWGRSERTKRDSISVIGAGVFTVALVAMTLGLVPERAGTVVGAIGFAGAIVFSWAILTAEDEGGARA